MTSMIPALSARSWSPIRKARALAIAVSLASLVACGDTDSGPDAGFNASGSEEPFSATVFPEPRLLDDASPSDLDSVTADGQGARTVFDPRVRGSIDINAHLFTARYADGATLEIVINPELGDALRAEPIADRYAAVIGQLPRATRRGVEALWIHGGNAAWGHAPGALIVHTGLEANFERDGIVAETLLHESVHVSLDPLYEETDAWRAAQAADASFISTYARENAATEDLAESFSMWLALRHLRDRIGDRTAELIEAAIPARLAFFDELGLDLTPTVAD